MKAKLVLTEFFSVMPLLFIGMSLLLPFSSQAQDFNQPESVVFDNHENRYFISNQGSGAIIQIDSIGVRTFFNTEPSAARGMLIFDNILYVATNSNTLRGFDLGTGTSTMNLDITEAQFLNDITTDSTGFLYVTGTATGKIFKVEISTQTYSTFVETNLISPNGILYDAPNNRLLICSFIINSPIQAISLADASVSTIVSTSLTNLDGLTVDNNGDFYISAWGDGSVYKFEKTFLNPPELVSSGHDGPADIFYNRQTDVLAVPNFNANTVDFISQLPSSVGENRNTIPEKFELNQNYPNPFNPTTTIRFALPERSFVTLELYNLLGKKVVTLVEEDLQPGEYKIEFDARGLASGVYIYRLETEGFVQSKKLVLIK